MVSYKRREMWQWHTEESQPREDEAGVSDTATTQGAPGWSHQSWERQGSALSSGLGGSMALLTWSQLSTLQNRREHTSLVLSHPVCNALSQWPWGTDLPPDGVSDTKRWENFGWKCSSLEALRDGSLWVCDSWAPAGQVWCAHRLWVGPDILCPSYSWEMPTRALDQGLNLNVQVDINSFFLSPSLGCQTQFWSFAFKFSAHLRDFKTLNKFHDPWEWPLGLGIPGSHLPSDLTLSQGLY